MAPPTQAQGKRAKAHGMQLTATNQRLQIRTQHASDMSGLQGHLLVVKWEQKQDHVGAYVAWQRDCLQSRNEGSGILLESDYSHSGSDRRDAGNIAWQDHKNDDGDWS